MLAHYDGNLACPISALTNEAEVDVRPHMDRWFQYIHAGVERMQVDGDPDRIALAIFAALQGGLVVMKASHSIAPLEAALDGALTILRSASENGRSDDVVLPWMARAARDSDACAAREPRGWCEAPRMRRSRRTGILRRALGSSSTFPVKPPASAKRIASAASLSG